MSHSICPQQAAAATAHVSQTIGFSRVETFPNLFLSFPTQKQSNPLLRGRALTPIQSPIRATTTTTTPASTRFQPFYAFSQGSLLSSCTSHSADSMESSAYRSQTLNQPMSSMQDFSQVSQSAFNPKSNHFEAAKQLSLIHAEEVMRCYNRAMESYNAIRALLFVLESKNELARSKGIAENGSTLLEKNFKGSVNYPALSRLGVKYGEGTLILHKNIRRMQSKTSAMKNFPLNHIDQLETNSIGSSMATPIRLEASSENQSNAYYTNDSTYLETTLSSPSVGTKSSLDYSDTKGINREASTFLRNDCKGHVSAEISGVANTAFPKACAQDYYSKLPDIQEHKASDLASISNDKSSFCDAPSLFDTSALHDTFTAYDDPPIGIINDGLNRRSSDSTLNNATTDYYHALLSDEKISEKITATIPNGGSMSKSSTEANEMYKPMRHCVSALVLCQPNTPTQMVPDQNASSPFVLKSCLDKFGLSKMPSQYHDDSSLPLLKNISTNCSSHTCHVKEKARYSKSLVWNTAFGQESVESQSFFTKKYSNSLYDKSINMVSNHPCKEDVSTKRDPSKNDSSSFDEDALSNTKEIFFRTKNLQLIEKSALPEYCKNQQAKDEISQNQVSNATHGTRKGKPLQNTRMIYDASYIKHSIRRCKSEIFQSHAVNWKSTLHEQFPQYQENSFLWKKCLFSQNLRQRRHIIYTTLQPKADHHEILCVNDEKVYGSSNSTNQIKPSQFDILRAMWVDTAAITIQRCYRGHLGRKKAHFYIKFRLWRLYVSQKARLIQKAVRTFLNRCQHEEISICAFVTKKRLEAKQRIHGALKKQMLQQQQQILELTDIICRVRNLAAIEIQRVWRGSKTREFLSQDTFFNSLNPQSFDLRKSDSQCLTNHLCVASPEGHTVWQEKLRPMKSEQSFDQSNSRVAKLPVPYQALTPLNAENDLLKRTDKFLYDKLRPTITKCVSTTPTTPCSHLTILQEDENLSSCQWCKLIQHRHSAVVTSEKDAPQSTCRHFSEKSLSNTNYELMNRPRWSLNTMSNHK